MITYITDLDVLLDFIKDFDDVVVDFSAKSWCIPCQRLAPHFEAAAAKLEGEVLFIDVDIDEAADIQAHYGIMTVPTVLRFKDGQQTPVEARTAVKLIQELTSP